MLENILNLFGLAWWVEVQTTHPDCTYYFGPFINADEAEQAKSGYVEDLEQEGAQEIQATVKRCKPKNLTVYEDSQPASSRSFSGQLQ